MDSISWLHISDIHIDSTNDRDNSLVRKAFLEKMRSVSTEQRIDFIVVTGDVANCARIEDYAIAIDFLHRLLDIFNISADSLFIVPGNHDLLRNAMKTETIMIRRLIDAGNNTDINNIFASDMFCQALNCRFSNFVSSMLNNATSTKPSIGQFYRTIEASGHKIGITALNSAWLSLGDSNDEGHMCLSEEQLYNTIPDWSYLDNNELNICIYHHPMSKWNPIDRTCESIKEHFDMMLCGHLHGVGSTADHSLTYVEMQAASLYYNRDWSNGYSLYEYHFDRSINNVEVSLSRYSDNQGGFFAPDTLSYRDAPDGRLHFTLKKKLMKRHLL